MLRWWIGASLYSIAFLPYIFSPPPIDKIYLSAYTVVLIVSLLIPRRNQHNPSKSSPEFFKAIIAATAVAALVSTYMAGISILIPQDTSKYVGAIWIFFSLIPATGSAFRLSRLGALIREKGLEVFQEPNSFQANLYHFAIEYSIQGWFRHGNFLLYSLAALTMYLYGWWLLGLPFLIYSVSLLVLASLVLRTLAKSFLAPFGPSEIADRIESIHPAKRLRGFFIRPSPKATLLIVSVLSLAAFTSLVENPFAGSNFIVFLLLLITYAASIFIYILTAGSWKSSK